MTDACAWNLNAFCFISRDVFCLSGVSKRFFARRHLARCHRRHAAAHPLAQLGRRRLGRLRLGRLGRRTRLQKLELRREPRDERGLHTANGQATLAELRLELQHGHGADVRHRASHAHGRSSQ